MLKDQRPSREPQSDARDEFDELEDPGDAKESCDLDHSQHPFIAVGPFLGGAIGNALLESRACG